MVVAADEGKRINIISYDDDAPRIIATEIRKGAEGLVRYLATPALN